MALKSIRIARLKQLQRERRISGPAELGKLIGKSVSQASDLLAARAPFGEKVARSIEEAAGLPEGWLDQVDEEVAADSSEPPVKAVPKQFLPTSARDYRTIAHTLAKALKDAEIVVTVEQFLLMADGIYQQWGEENRPEKTAKAKSSS